jgi:hypothetical protein
MFIKVCPQWLSVMGGATNINEIVDGIEQHLHRFDAEKENARRSGRSEAIEQELFDLQERGLETVAHTHTKGARVVEETHV